MNHLAALPWPSILTSAFCSFAAINLFFWLFRFRLLARYDSSKEPLSDIQRPLSVIICAKNEAENLKQNLPFILDQDYPEFEVIVVNDYSFDKTSAIVLDIQKIYSNLVLLNLEEETLPGKKAALKQGILSAQHNWLILTDADCRPSGRQWLQRVQSSFHLNKKIVLGYGPYQKQNGWLNKFIRFEAFYTAIQYLSFSLAKDPYMGVGRNLAYHRSLFDQAKGFSRHEHLASGDDDLFVNQMASANNTSICIAPQAHVYSQPETNLRSYYRQKRRHFSVGGEYRRKHQITLGLLALSHVGFFLTGLLVLLLSAKWSLLILTIYLVRIGIIFQVSFGICRHLGERDLLAILPLLDIAFAAYYLVFAPVSITGSHTQQWK